MGPPETDRGVPTPLVTDQDGVVRVGGTRVTLDTVVYACEDGASPEEIALLADINSPDSYYLRNRSAVREYLDRREPQAEEIRRLNESDAILLESANGFSPELVR